MRGFYKGEIMRKGLENPWKVVEKKYCVILHKFINGVHVKEPKNFRRFEDAKSYYKRMEEKKGVLVFGVSRSA